MAGVKSQQRDPGQRRRISAARTAEESETASGKKPVAAILSRVKQQRKISPMG
jgi:hypothetical protein